MRTTKFPRIITEKSGWWLEASMQLDDLRPLDCCLTHNDFDRLEQRLETLCNRKEGVLPLVTRLMRMKLTDARVVLAEDAPEDLVTLGSRVLFTIDKNPPETRILQDSASQATLGFSLQLSTLLGATLIGMRIGQRTLLPLSDGTFATLFVRDLPFQPEAQRRAAGGPPLRGPEDPGPSAA